MFCVTRNLVEGRHRRRFTSSHRHCCLSHDRHAVGRVTVEQTFPVKVDAERRPTPPQSLLDAAGVGDGQDLIAHLEAPGRIVLEGPATVLEGPATVLARLQAAVRAGKDGRGITASLADELLGERAGDTSLDPSPIQPDLDAEPDVGR